MLGTDNTGNEYSTLLWGCQQATKLIVPLPSGNQALSIDVFRDARNHVIGDRANTAVSVAFVETLRIGIEVCTQQEHIADWRLNQGFSARQKLPTNAPAALGRCDS